MLPEVPDFLQPLVSYVADFQRVACHAAIARHNESVPHLIRSIEWAVENLAEARDEDYMLHTYAVYILAELREPLAYGPIVRMARSPDVDDLLGETVASRLSALLAAVCGNDFSPIEEIIRDEQADEYARGAAVHALGVLTFEGRITREELSARLADLIGSLRREPGNQWDCIVSTAAEFRLSELLPEIQKLDEEGITDPCFWDPEDVERDIVKPYDKNGPAMELEYAPITSAVDEMEWWAAFNKKDADPEDSEDGWLPPIFGEATPIRRDAPKVGRNDPCPCGSGKKFKKCCGAGG